MCTQDELSEKSPVGMGFRQSCVFVSLLLSIIAAAVVRMAGMGNNEPHYIPCLLLKVAIFAGSNTKVTDILYDVTTTTHFIEQ